MLELDREGEEAFFTTDRARIARFLREVHLVSNKNDGKVQEKNVTSTANLDVRIVLTTIGSEAEGISIAKTLVDEKLAACVNVLPQMISIYRWKGSVEQDREHQIVIKTTADRLAALESRLRELHPYELPEFLVIDPAGGGPSYMAWVKESVAP